MNSTESNTLSFFGRSTDSSDYFDFLAECQDFLEQEGIVFGLPYNLVPEHWKAAPQTASTLNGLVFDDSEELFSVLLDRFGHCSFEVSVVTDEDYIQEDELQVQILVSHIDAHSGEVFLMERCDGH